MDTNTEEALSKNKKLQNARDIQSVTHAKLLWAEQRSCSVADDFIKLEVQIATIIFAFASLFISKFSAEVLVNFSPLTITVMKLAFSLSILSLILSLAFGLLHLKAHEAFWDRVLHQRIIRYNKWSQVTQDKSSFEEAIAYQTGTSLENGVSISAPSWTWILQTICLGIGVIVLSILTIVFLFNQ